MMNTTRVWAGGMAFGAGVGKRHQRADLPGQPDFFEESDETDEATEGGDGLGGGGEPDLPSGEDGITRSLVREVCNYSTQPLYHMACSQTMPYSTSVFGLIERSRFRGERAFTGDSC